MKSHLLNILPRFFIVLLLSGVVNCTSAQQNTFEESAPSFQSENFTDTLSRLHVRKIIISGNKKTKEYIILREMALKPGDSIVIAKMVKTLEKDRQHIYNTTLFVEVVVEPVIINAFDVDINVSVKERWYIFPLPEVKFVDGNLNKWLAHYKGDLRRINYGVKFLHNNLTGRKDQLSIHLLNGYTKTISFTYRAPYANPSLTSGFLIGGGYIKSHEVPYKTSYNNEFIYFKRDHFVKNEWNIQLGYSIRKGLKISHLFNLNYTNIRIDDSITTSKYNTAYFNKPVSKIGYIDFYYTLRYIDVNNVLYPLTGVAGSVGITKRGLGFSGGVNSFSFDAEYNKYWSLGKKWYASTQLQGNIKLPFKQAFINQQAMGYLNNYVRGFDYELVDGVAYAISKFNLKKEIFNFNINTIFKKSKTLNKIPFRIYAKTFADMGYCYNREDFVSRLNNKFLASAGLGLDIVTFYDIQIRIEYSVNQLGQKGLFLHNEKGF